MESGTLGRLDRPVLIEIFSFVPVKDFGNLMMVSKHFRDCCKIDYLWKDACSVLFPFVSNEFYQAFMENFRRFKRLSDSFYKVISKLEESGARQLVSKLKSTSNPKLASILNYYHYEPNKSKLDKRSSYFAKLPQANSHEMFWLHLLYNGQNSLDPGLFGCYEFYDVYVSLAYTRLDQAQSPNILAYSENNNERLFIFQDSENTLMQGKDAVYCTTGFGKLLKLADSVTDYIENFAFKLQNGILRVMDGKVSSHEYDEYSSSNSEHGIKITASALFVPHLSRHDRYLWTYLITIEEDCCRRVWKLTTRTWRIEDSNGDVNVVDRQPGVIGLYPKVCTGCEPTSYSSCCYLKTTSGRMSGFFTFVDQKNGETVDVAIKTFRLEIPLGSTLSG